MRITGTTLIALFTLTASVGAALGQTTTYIAATGDAAAGWGTGVVFGSSLTPTMNAAGQVAFQGSVSGGGTTASDLGVWRWSAGATALVARTGVTPAGYGAGVTFSGVRVPIINDTGDLVFRANIAGTGITAGSNDFGIWQYGPTGNGLRIVTGQTAPGFSGTVTGLTTQAVGSGRVFAVGASVTGSASGPFTGVPNGAIYTQNANASYSISPGFINGSFLPSSSFPISLSNGIGGFVSLPTTLLVNNSRQFVSGFGAPIGCDMSLTQCFADAPLLIAGSVDSGAASTVGRSGTTLGTTGSVQAVLGLQGFNNAGAILYTAAVTGNTTALCLGTSASSTALLATGQTTDAPAATIISFPNAVLGPSGDVFTVVGTSVGSVVGSRIMHRSSTGTLTTVAFQGQGAPGLPPGVTFGSLQGPPPLNMSGQNFLAFLAPLTGAGVTTSSNLALYVWRPSTGLVPVVRTGDALVVRGTGRTVSNIVLNLNTTSAGGEDGRSRAVRGGTAGVAGEVVYSLAFTDGTSAIGLTSIPDGVSVACCQPDGSCTTVGSFSACTGVARALGTTCATAACPVPPGACCAPDGSCSTAATAAGCAGVFQGAGSTCAATVCPIPSGACCAADGSCTPAANAAACVGSFQGAGTACSGAPCPVLLGACCRGPGCVVSLQADCSGPFTRFTAPGQACNAAGNNSQPCCRADFNR
ncbi:MAG: hypothetical protein K2Q20_11775, partial [Phycisphaerales bacterium]|nr:hypothetical protein [Phycisphaerales bacterium]